MRGAPIRLQTRLVHRMLLRAPSIAHCRHFTQSAPQTKPPSPNTIKVDRERLKGTKKYPLSRQLAAIGPQGDPVQSTRYTPRIRAQIVSPDLCDDVLDYIGPSLEKYKGCDILDLNPGACLWSQKLHDYLQPQTHVLFDSCPSMWEDFQKPLLQKPGSKYRLFHGDMTKREAFEELFASGILPRQKPFERDRPYISEPNNTLLVTGCLMWNPKAPGFGFDSVGKQLLSLFSFSAWDNTNYHINGPVRSLFWTTESDFRGAVPRSHFSYSKASFLMNCLTKTVQVVTPEHTPRGAGHHTIARQPQYEIQSIIRAMQKGRENGMTLPEHRRDWVHEMADEIAHQNQEQGKPAETALSTPDMITYLHNRVRDGKSTVGIDSARDIKGVQVFEEKKKDPDFGWIEKSNGKRVRRVRSAEYRKLNKVTSVLNQNRRIRIKTSEVANAFEAMFDRECEVLAMEEGAEKEDAKKALESMDEELERELERMYNNRRTAVLTEVNERISLKSPVPRLQWDNRPYEPLVMQEDELWPTQRACLIDVEPRPRLLKREQVEYLTDFAYGLLNSPNTSVTKALDQMQAGASCLVDQAPSVKDPARGGRLNLERLKVNMLTNDMIMELFQAYNAWPFKSASSLYSKYFKNRGTQRRKKD